MKTKNGIARKVKFDIELANHWLKRTFRIRKDKSPKITPRRKKTMAVPAKEKATG